MDLPHALPKETWCYLFDTGRKGDDIDDRSKQPNLMRRFVNIMISHVHTLDKHCPLRHPCDK